jgi:hypothetical protein
MQSQTGRQIVMQRLSAAIQRANTADLQRAAMFLEWAWDVRKGCAKQRGSARRAQSNAWQKQVDGDVRW